MSERQGERERGETGGWETERDRKKQKEETQKEKERNTEGSYSYPLCIEVISIMYTMENDTYLIEWLREGMFYLDMEHQ